MAKRHLHKLKRINLGQNKDYFVYKCQRPGCTTYYVPTMCPGLMVMCFACDAEFLFVRRNLAQVKTKCPACTGNKEEPEEQDPKIQKATDDILAALGKI